MNSILLRNFAWSGPAAAAYLILLPLAARSLDRRYELGWPLPSEVFLLAVPLMVYGSILALWSVILFARVGRGTPNPMAPPQHLVSQGPYRYSRNPMMLGGWLLGLGLALALRSAVLLAALALIVAGGAIYVRLIEEPRLRVRFGRAYEDYTARVPRWMRLC